MSGTRREFWRCEQIKIRGEVISFAGWEVYATNPGTNHYYLNTDNECLFVFHVGYWPDHRIKNLLRCLDAGDMVSAMIEYRATDPKNEPTCHRKQIVSACGNWVTSAND